MNEVLVILPYPGSSVGLGAPRGNGTADSETTGNSISSSLILPGSTDAQRRCKPDGSTSGLPLPISGARGWPRSRPAARERPPQPRQTVRGRAPLEVMSFVAPPSPLSPTLSNSQPPRSLALDCHQVERSQHVHHRNLHTCQTPPQAQLHWTTQRLRAGEARRVRSEPPRKKRATDCTNASPCEGGNDAQSAGCSRMDNRRRCSASSSSGEKCASSRHAASSGNRAPTVASQVYDDLVPSASALRFMPSASISRRQLCVSDRSL